MNIVKRRCSFERCSLCFAKNIGKNVSSKYSQKLVVSAKKSATDTIKTASKKQFKK